MQLRIELKKESSCRTRRSGSCTEGPASSCTAARRRTTISHLSELTYLRTTHKTGMSVTKGDTIRVHYTGKLTDGTQFDSSEGRDPLEFSVGSGMVIPGFDNGVIGMDIGETRTLEIPARDAYGEKSEDMIVAIPRKEFGADFTAEIGEQLLIQLGDGNQIPVTITQIDAETVTLDANHKLAGKDLIFTVTLVEIITG